MSPKQVDYKFMAIAIQLAKKGQYTTHPNPRVACVITKNNKIIGKGFHKRAGEPHAEINALANCKQNGTQEKLQGATAYVTLEPCSHTGRTPPCANALIEAQVSRVVIAMQDPNPQVAGQGIQRLQDAGIEVEVGILEEQSRQLNPGFIKRMETGLPWVRIKLAMSLDGRTAMASGESKWITSNESRQDVQKLRASADAILTGIGTVLADDPSLNVRLSTSELGIEGEVRQPKRVVIDSQLRTPLDAKIFKIEGETLLVFASSNDETTDIQNKKLISAFQAMGASFLEVDKNAEKNKDENQDEATNTSEFMPLKIILQELAKQEINEIHVEAGATLCGSLIQQKLVDEIVLYIAPIFMGSDAKGLLNLPGLEYMKDKIELSIDDIRAVGKDFRLTIRPIY